MAEGKKDSGWGRAVLRVLISWPAMAAWISLFWIVFATLEYYLPANLKPMANLELALLELRYVYGEHRDPPPEVVIVAIDDRSIRLLEDEYGKFPWPRQTYARLMEAFTTGLDGRKPYGPRVVAWDVLFLEADIGEREQRALDTVKEVRAALDALTESMAADGGDPAVLDEIRRLKTSLAEAEAGLEYLYSGDAAFQSAMETGIDKNVWCVLGVNFVTYREQSIHYTQGREMSGGSEEVLRGSQYDAAVAQQVEEAGILPQQTVAVQAPIEDLASFSAWLGHVLVLQDPDGEIRHVQALLQYGTELYMPLGLAALYMYECIQEPDTMIRLNKLSEVDMELIMGPPDPSRPPNPDGSQPILPRHHIPVDFYGRAPAHFYGPTRTFPYYSIVDVLHGKVPPWALRDRIVFIGSEATGAFDHYVTPFADQFPGVEFHATFVANTLRNDFLRRPPRHFAPAFWLGIISCCLIVVFAMWKLRAIFGVVVSFSLLASIFGLGLWLFNQRIWINLSLPMVATSTTFIAASIRRGLREEAGRRLLKNVFQAHVSAQVFDHILADPGSLKLGGERREATVVFSDVAGFTSMSEKMQPEEVVPLMNEYFTEMEDAIQNQEGYLDKYIGDGIMSEFGVPVVFPDHAARAVRAALEMLERLDLLNARWVARGIQPIKIRIGINTGPMVVGEFGTHRRKNYTAFGNTVNLAARLEAANKEFGTVILASSRTHDAAKGEFEFREVDNVRVPGKQIPEAIFEVVGLRGAIPADRKEASVLFAEGREFYMQRNWNAAIRCFQQAVAAWPGDKTAAIFLKRCEDFKLEPPAADWDGVYDVTKK